MKPIKITYDKQKSTEVEEGYIVDNYLSKDHGMNYSMVRTHLNGRHPFMKNIHSDRTYYLIKGEAKFYFEDSIISLSEGDMLVIPKNTKYAFRGQFDAVLVDSPAFSSEDDIIFNEEIID